MGFSRQEYWSGLPFPSPVAHIPSDLSTMIHPSWVAPWVWLSFFELDKAVILVWLDWLDFCDYGFSVSALWCPLATPTVLLGFVLPWTWGISSHLLQQSAAALLTLDEGYLLTTAPPDLERGIAPKWCWHVWLSHRIHKRFKFSCQCEANVFSFFMNLFHEWRAFLNIFHWRNYKNDRYNTMLQLMDF